MRFVLALLLILLSTTGAIAQRFAAIAFHDVIDEGGPLGSDDVSTGQLVAFFDWLKGNGWTPISLDDIEAARTGARPLPDKAILITFDDGDATAYTRAYPLLLAYRFHAVFALVGSWMDAPMNGKVRYGDVDVPRKNFLSWDEAREMAASGLAEFASHGYNLHRGISGNPQGSQPPAAATWAYDAKSGTYENDSALEARVYADLMRSIALMRRELGRAPRALAWPYGRFAGPALTAATKAGFRFLLTLTPAPADASQPLDIGRLFPSQEPKLADLAVSLRFEQADPEQRRVLCLGLDGMAAGTSRFDTALGHAIEDIRSVGANIVVLDPVAEKTSDGGIGSVWFHSALLPTRADTFGFAAWQLHSRAGVNVFAKIDLAAAVKSIGANRVPDLVREIVRAAPFDGILLDPPGAFSAGSGTATGPDPWTVRTQREAIVSDPSAPGNDLALIAWRAAAAERPDLALAIAPPEPLSGAWPAPGADWILVPTTDGTDAAARALAARGWLAPAVSGRLVLSLPSQDLDEAADAMRRAQALGVASFAFCPAPPLPASAGVAAAFSSSRFPLLP